MTKKMEVYQETLFSFLGEENPQPLGESKNTKPSQKKGKVTKPVTPIPKKEEPIELNENTIIRYGGENIPLTDYFTNDEFKIGLVGKVSTEENEEEELRPITADDIRKRLEQDFAELTEELTHMSWIKEKNLIVPILQARKKGAGMKLGRRHGIYLDIQDAVEHKRTHMFFPASDGNVYHIRETECLTICTKTNHVPDLPNLKEGIRFKLPKIEWDILSEFMKISRYYAMQYETEVHGEVYWNGTRYFLFIPKQEVSKEWVEPTEIFTQDEQAIKVMEIHSHNLMNAYFSEQDNESEQAPILYAVVGRVTDFLPQIQVRTCLNGTYLAVDPKEVFDSPFGASSVSYELEQIKVKGDSNDDRSAAE
ncbi:hypothetical protein T458_05370 [Brevibacillus panacihumi W25]|uniref:JAB domain-containing protein n=1 Tax=Brevibacillus panacihumi W25 TaxID=1408254 RepID=V6MB42_9BACL|nr:hypothetical protein [Brevibacillus panacihumi]EST55759.1 hypothetical protein T458_05370 [Brevibacillus panacihumi W25]